MRKGKTGMSRREPRRQTLDPIFAFFRQFNLSYARYDDMLAERTVGERQTVWACDVVERKFGKELRVRCARTYVRTYGRRTVRIT
jgi:hypothetical protein